MALAEQKQAWKKSDTFFYIRRGRKQTGFEYPEGMKGITIRKFDYKYKERYSCSLKTMKQLEIMNQILKGTENVNLKYDCIFLIQKINIDRRLSLYFA